MRSRTSQVYPLEARVECRVMKPGQRLSLYCGTSLSMSRDRITINICAPDLRFASGDVVELVVKWPAHPPGVDRWLSVWGWVLEQAGTNIVIAIRQYNFLPSHVASFLILVCWLLLGSPFAASYAFDEPNQPLRAYDDDRIRVGVPAGWSVSPVTETSAPSARRIGAVLSKERFRIYLLTHHSQASGVDGGRFGEISRYVTPWMTATDPWGCFEVFEKRRTPVTPNLSRVDLFWSSSKVTARTPPECAHLHPAASQPTWFGSYFTESCKGPLAVTTVCDGFFLNDPPSKPPDNSDRQMTFTVTYNSRDASTLPSKTDPSLAAALGEASAVVKSIRYK